MKLAETPHDKMPGIARDEPMHPVQISGLRAMSLAERFAKGLAFLRSTRLLLAAGVRHRHPGWTEEQISSECRRLISHGGH